MERERTLSVIGVILFMGLLTATFVAYTYARPPQELSVNEEFCGEHDEYYGVQNHWNIHDRYMMDDVYENETGSSTYNETEAFYYSHHGCGD